MKALSLKKTNSIPSTIWKTTFVRSKRERLIWAFYALVQHKERRKKKKKREWEGKWWPIRFQAEWLQPGSWPCSRGYSHRTHTLVWNARVISLSSSSPGLAFGLPSLAYSILEEQGYGLYIWILPTSKVTVVSCPSMWQAWLFLVFTTITYYYSHPSTFIYKFLVGSGE